MRVRQGWVLGMGLLVALAIPVIAWSQATTGTLYGTVTDEQKAVLPGVGVEVRNIETGLSRTLTTDGAGQFRALNLPPGQYEVAATLEGFVPAKRAISLEIGAELPIDLQLKVGALTEDVVVEGKSNDVQLSSAAVAGGVVSTTQIAELPLNGRSFMQLTTLQPGVTVSRSSGRGFTGSFSNTQVSVGGARPEMTGYLLEGTNIADMSDKAPSSLAGVTLGVDAVREFSVQTHDYSAEFGRAAGGIVSAVTKSGTNALHGSVFEFLRNSGLDAPNYFDPGGKTPPFQRNQFGGTIGGPIVPSKLFYFFSYEGLRQQLSSTRIARLPDANAHLGLLPDGKGGLNNVGVSPLVKPYLDLLYPIPTGQNFGDGTAELRHVDDDPTNEGLYVAKVDWQIGNNDSVFVRYSHDASDTTAHQDHPLFVEPTTSLTRYVTVQHQHLFSSSLLNVARIAANRTARTDDYRATIDIPQSLFFTTDPHFGSLTIANNSVAQVGTTSSTPVSYDQNLYQFSDTLTWSAGGHTMKFGADVQRYHFDGFSYSRLGGEFRFNTLQDFLTAKVNRFTGNLPGTDTQRNLRQTYAAFFAQDEWRAAKRVTLNYGLRYEFVTVPYDTEDRIAGLLSLDDLESGPKGVTPGAPLFKNPSLRSFAPRLGLAWKPFGDDKTSVKAGTGIFYQPLTTSYYDVTSFRIYPYFAGVDIRSVPTFGPPIQNLLNQGTGLAVQKRSEFIDYDARQPRTWQYHASVERELMGGLVGEVGYVGTRGYHLPFYGDPNAVPVQFNAADGHYQVVPGAGLRYPDWGRIRTRTNVARSEYNGMTATVKRRFSQGLLFQGSYTYSHSRDTWSGGLTGSTDYDNGAGSATDWFNPEAEYGPSNYDVPHTFVLNAVYVLPLGRGLSGLAAGFVQGWQIGAILNVAGGVPFTPLIGFDYAKDLSSDGDMQKPDFAPGRNGSNAIIGSPDNWFDTSAFVLPPTGEYGTAGRNSLRGPNLRELDLSVFKNTPVFGKNLQLRIEIFNVLNRANFATPVVTTLFNPDGTLVPGASRITSTVTTARQVQLGVKYVF